MDGQQIRDARKQLGLTQTQLAEVMGYSGKSYVSQVEIGMKSIGGAAERLLKAYLAGYRPEDWPVEK